MFDTTRDNTARSEVVEQFLVESAVKAGVVRKIEIRPARNPNKWDK